ncbi:MAG: hypothetical protein ACI9ES_002034 [Oceanospirillaceae bacterium]|jgi:uncharacterized protein YjbI with pentapeptide repeats
MYALCADLRGADLALADFSGVKLNDSKRLNLEQLLFVKPLYGAEVFFQERRNQTWAIIFVPRLMMGFMACLGKVIHHFKCITFTKAENDTGCVKTPKCAQIITPSIRFYKTTELIKSIT